MLLKFINRKTELEFLEGRYKSKEFEFIVLYGRRRVGKTELIKEFIKDKEHIYFLCDKQGTERNAARFKTRVADYLNEPAIESNDLEDVFEHIVKRVRKRIVIVFDEFSYLVEKDSAVPSIFQTIIDEALKQSNIMLIFCGSSISMMEKGTLSYNSPLYGRKTGHWKVSPLEFRESCKFFPANSIIKNIEFWSILDGIPFYLEKFSDNGSVLVNIEKQILRKEGKLYEEADFLLKEELREPDVYKSILTAIGSGKTKVVEIANISGVKAHDLDKYLKVLIRLGIIKKESPLTAAPKMKKTIYRFNNNFFHFWFRFCEPFKSNIEISELDGVVKKIRDELNAFVGKKFEDICISSLKGLIDINLNKVGIWWGAYREGEERKISEIDVIALSEQEKNILFAECKWQDDVDTKKIVEELKEKSKLVEWNNKNRKEYFAVFAKSFKKKIKEDNIFLFDLKDIEKTIK